MRELYVYWKVARADAGAARRAACALADALAARAPGLQLSLLQRADETGDQATFMETYRCAGPGGVDASLQALIEAEAAVAMRSLGPPRRHTEVFDRLPPAD